MTAPSPEPAARLYDVRYSRYDGGHEPRWRAVVSLARSSAARSLGLRKSTGAKLWPFLLVTAAFLPAVVAVGVPLLAPGAPPPQEILSYRQLLSVTLLVVVAFAATTLPSLLTRERRDRVLSLYFSTALSGKEYLLGKVLAATGLMLLVSLGPLLALFLGTVLTAQAPLDRLRDDIGDLPGIVAAGVVVALFYAALGLAAGSLTPKRVFAVGGLLGLLLVSPVLAGLTYDLSQSDSALAIDLAQASAYAAATLLPGTAEDRPLPPDALVWAVTLGVIALAALLLVLRYGRGDDR